MKLQLARRALSLAVAPLLLPALPPPLLPIGFALLAEW